MYSSDSILPCASRLALRGGALRGGDPLDPRETIVFVEMMFSEFISADNRKRGMEGGAVRMEM